MARPVIYQLLPRLFGNECENCKPNGTIEENGCGKLNQITSKCLNGLKKFGVTHVWYTGLIEHATQTDYSSFGIRRDHAAVVKGKAGSPYAIKDYYDIDPDLSTKPSQRMKEFDALITRTHKADLQFLMDFVPNHVARQYHSDAKPKGVVDLGEKDNNNQAFCPDNNFYYIPNAPLCCEFDMQQTEAVPYREMPCRATGNDRFDNHPNRNDWYETIKLNYGVDYVGGHTPHFRPIPDTWKKMRDILLFWAGKGVDGFRCDMAEMVPVEFWQWAIAEVKELHPAILFIAEVYCPDQYRNYLYRGGFDYLYDKVGLYDTLKGITRGEQSAQNITYCWQSLGDLEPRMLNFLENHDEQRIASNFYIGNGYKAKAAFLVSALMGLNPVMVYAGQELGERGMDVEGFSGLDGRTTIFDYWSVNTLRRWRNGGKYDSALLTPEESELQQFYHKVLVLINKERAFSEGLFFDLMYVNPTREGVFNAQRQYAFIRKYEEEIVLAFVNFDYRPLQTGVSIPQHAFDYLKMKAGSYMATELLTGSKLKIELNSFERLFVKVPAYSGVLLKIKMK